MKLFCVLCKGGFCIDSCIQQLAIMVIVNYNNELMSIKALNDPVNFFFQV